MTIEGRSNPKINALSAKMKAARAGTKTVDQVADLDCDLAHYCVNGCCPHEADMGNDGDWVCCDEDQAPHICASGDGSLCDS